MDIEKEIQARIEFKMNELLDAVQNAAMANWTTAFNETSPKHTYYWEAFKQFKSMLVKEMQMPPPYDDMAAHKKRMAADKAISEIMKRFCDRGQRDYYEKERVLVGIIDDVQNWDKLN